MDEQYYDDQELSEEQYYDDQELLEEQQTFFSNKILQFIIRLLTALAFSFFTVYQIVMLFAVDASKVGRLLGIICFLMITLASFFALGNKKVLLLLHMILLIAGLILNFLFKLMNVPAIFGNLDFSVTPYVLNFFVFILSQLGTILLAVYFLVVRNKKETLIERKLTFIMMSIVIVLFVACFVMECIMMIAYHVNYEFSLKVALLSRAAYCFGFIGTAVGFMLPAPFIEEDEEYKKKEGDFIYSEDVEDEIDLIM